MPAPRLALTVDADPRGLAEALDRLDAFWAAHGVPEDATFRLRLAVDELVNNVIDHGYPATARGAVHLAAEWRADRVTLDLVDDAALFDPFAAPPPDLESEVEDRPLGGLGVHLVRELMDEARYDADDGRNHVHLALEIAS